MGLFLEAGLSQLDGWNLVWDSVESEVEANLASFLKGLWLCADKRFVLKCVKREVDSERNG